MFSNDKYYVTNHEYFNTGGGCMVSVFTVYDRSINATRFVIANDEGFNYQTADTVSCGGEFEFDELEKIIIESHDWSALTCEPMPLDHLFDDNDWELFKYCQFEFYKKDCQRFKTKVTLPIEWLPPVLYANLSTAAKDWLHANDMEVTTDGEHVFMPDEWITYQSEQLDKQLQSIKVFKQWFEDLVNDAFVDNNIEKLYDSELKLTFIGRELTLPFDARTYEAVSELLRDVIEEW